MAKFEPVRLWLYGLIAPVVALLAWYGVVADDAAPLWIALATAVLTIVGAEVSRSKVVPVEKLPPVPPLVPPAA
jgi:hypothetical protein